MMQAVEIVRRFYGQIWNEGNLEAIPEICHEDIVFRGSLGEWAGAALFTIEAGRIIELWVLGDVHGLMGQLSANAEPRPPAS